MRFKETLFDEYIQSIKKYDLHPKQCKIYNSISKDISNIPNFIFYGPPGVGKYTQVLSLINKFSPSELKYEKKMTIPKDKQSSYIIKISDTHYEVDLSLLGCASKPLWHEIYVQISDAIAAKTNKSGIIVCKNFHTIHSELLEIFYSYIQSFNASPITLKFIIITEHISFIPENIINCCELVSFSRPTKKSYSNCIEQKNLSNISLDQISNIKSLGVPNANPESIYDNIIDYMINIKDLKFLDLRDKLYNIFILNLDVTEFVWYMFSSLNKRKKIPSDKVSNCLIKIFSFLQQYNNNYRPIYHLESYIFYLLNLIHGHRMCSSYSQITK